MLSQSAQVARLENGVLHLSFDSPALAQRFGSGPHAENVSLALRETLGLKVRVEGAHGIAPSAPAAGPTMTAAAQAPAMGTPLGAATPASPGTPPSAPSAPAPAAAPQDDYEDISDDDVSADDGGAAGVEVVTKLLGGRIVDE